MRRKPKFPDLGNIEWVPEYMVPERWAGAIGGYEKVIEPFIDQLQSRPGRWAIYATGRKTPFPRSRISPTYRIYTEVRNKYEKDTDTFTIFMRWTGPAMKEEGES